MQSLESITAYCENTDIETSAQMKAYLHFVQQEEKKNSTSIMDILNSEIEFYPKGDIEAYLSSAKEDADIIEFLIAQEKECIKILHKLRVFRDFYTIFSEKSF